MEELLKKLFALNPTPNMSGFRFADLFDNERWRTADRPSYGSKRDETIEFREYVPRPVDVASAAAELSLPRVEGNPTFHVPSNRSGANRRHYERNQGTTVKTVTSPDGGVTTTETTKFLPYERLADTRDAGLTPSRFMPSTFAEEGPGMASYAPPTMRDRFAEEGPGMGSYRGPVRTTGNPFDYPMRTAIHNMPPRYTDVYQEMPGAQTYGPPGQLRHNMGTVGAVNSPFDRRTSEQTFAYNMVPLVRPEITPFTTQRVPQGNTIPPSGFNQQSQLNRFPYSGMAPMSDADKIRMLELLLIGRDD